MSYHLSFCSCLAFLLAAALSLARAFSTLTPLARDTRSPPRQLFLSVSSFTACHAPCQGKGGAGGGNYIAANTGREGGTTDASGMGREGQGNKRLISGWEATPCQCANVCFRSEERK